MRCELSSRRVLPAIRRELVKALLKKDLKQKQVAELLGITPAAVTQYLKGKRGIIELNESEVEEIQKLINKNNKINESGLCKLCKRIQERLLI